MKEVNMIQDKEIETQFVEKKSRFIATLFYVETMEEIEEKIQIIKKKYFDARHHCIAYRIGEADKVVEKASDDGEPAGTAGMPMLTILQKQKMVNCLIIVTRYFGGTLLGTGGLARAYANSLLQALAKTQLVTKVWGEELEVVLEYPYFENFKYYCKNNAIRLTKIEYKQDIVCHIELEEKVKHKLYEDFATKKIILKDRKDLSKKYITKVY